MIQELDRKIPDLRTLNTLHSEKLLAFKMEEQNQANSADSQMQHSPVSIASSHRSSSSVDSLDSFHNSTLSHGSSSSCNDNDLPIRRLSANTCPYKFPRALESPSGDSGIESGACSSPARSEQDIPITPSSNNHHHHNHHSSQDDMPVLKRALQAPPMIDTNLLMNEAYRPHKKFRYSVSEKSHSGSPPPSMSSSQQSSTSPAPYSPVFAQSPSSSSSAQQRNPSTGPTPPPHQLYPQLASALTQPRISNCPQQSGPNNMKHFKSPLQIQHSTLSRTLSEKSKHLTEDDAVTSDLLHSIIMRNGNGDTAPSRHYSAMETDNPSACDNQVINQPLNLSTKIQIC
jgi:hypothetical protein